MQLQEFIEHLTGLESLTFMLPDGNPVPPHFHITEVGHIMRDFVDCGWERRIEQWVNLQLWEADDHEHRIEPKKLLAIIAMAKDELWLSDDDEVSVEYQDKTVGRYSLTFEGDVFVLVPTKTDCLAKEACGISDTPKSESSCCGGGCC